MERKICTESNVKKILKSFKTNIHDVKFVIVIEV